MTISGNSGSFGYDGDPTKSSNQSNLKHEVLEYALIEVQIGTPDSVALAAKTLFKHGIEIPALTSLLDLQKNTEGKNRNAKFAKQLSSLQSDVIKKITELDKFSR